MPRPPNPHPYHKSITRWIDERGKQVKPNTPGAQKIKQTTSTYYADIRGHTVSLKTSDLQLAWKRLNDRLREAHDEELGIRDEYSKHAKVPLQEHLDKWLEILKAKGTGQKHRDLIQARLSLLFDLAGWKRLADISKESATMALAKLQELKPAKGGSLQGRGAQTRGHYITHLKSFCRWAVDSDRLRKDPVRTLEKPRIETDRRHMRREPTREEIAELFRHLEDDAAPIRHDMSGRQRALGYKVAMATGYRGVGELQSLTAASFDFKAATVTLSAAVEKARRGDVHPLPAWLVAELEAWFAAGGETWGSFGQVPGRVLHADLDAARAAWIAAATDGEERKQREESNFLRYEVQGPDGLLFVDMHSLRVFYISELAADPQIDIKTLMRLARHAKPEMSLAVYARHRESSVRAATDRLAPPGEPKKTAPDA